MTGKLFLQSEPRDRLASPAQCDVECADAGADAAAYSVGAKSNDTNGSSSRKVIIFDNKSILGAATQ